MMTRLLTTTMLAVALIFTGPAWSYDAAMAESYARLFAPVQGAGAGKALRHIGFENVHILKGGFKAMTGYLGPKEANTPHKPDAVRN
jgi:hypothetical protein